MATLQGNQSCSLWWLVSSLGLRASGHLSWATSEWLRTQHQPSTCTWGRWNGQECEYLGPDYLGRAGPLGWFADRHGCQTHQILTTWEAGQHGKPGRRLWATGIPGSRADTFLCNRTQWASPSGRVCNAHAHWFNHDGERQDVQIDYGNGRRRLTQKTINWR